VIVSRAVRPQAWESEEYEAKSAAFEMMQQASAILHQGEDVEREVAWLLEDLVDFLQCKGRQQGEQEVSNHYCSGSLAEIIPLDP
jgi:hypothetical protein